MDTSPYFSNTGQSQQQTQSGQPQGLNNGTATGGVAAVIKAIMDGNDQYKQQQAAKMGMMGNPQFQQPGSTVLGGQGPITAGGPNGPAPIMGNSPGYTDPSTQSGGLATPSAAFSPGGSAATPQSQAPFQSYGGFGYNSPTMNALAAPIPGIDTSLDTGAGFTAPNPLSVGGSWGS